MLEFRFLVPAPTFSHSLRVAGVGFPAERGAKAWILSFVLRLDLDLFPRIARDRSVLEGDSFSTSLAPPGGVMENSQQPRLPSEPRTRNDSPLPSLHLGWRERV